MNQTYIQLITSELSLAGTQVTNTCKMLDEGSTVPFISRYRKEATGSLDEVAIAAIKDKLNKLREIDKRKETIINTIEEQGKLTPELKEKLISIYDLNELEDIYLPYKPKRKTRAVIAKEKGLEPLAKIVMAQRETDILTRAERFLSDEIENTEEALQGARDIIAEWINENIFARNKIRYLFGRESVIRSKVIKGKEEEGIKFTDYFAHKELLRKCPSHRLLAIRRGESEGFLRVSIQPPEPEALSILEKIFVKDSHDGSKQVELATKDSYKRLLSPSIETEFNNSSKEKADIEAIKVFAENLRQLLMSPPLGQKRILAIDPGYRSGCKLVCLDEQGNLLTNATIYPHKPQDEKKIAAKRLSSLVETYKIDAIAIGNGTASRETEYFVKKLKFNCEVRVYIVSENGASIYSASSVAREEFPEYDVTVRGSVSIGRRLMDPLAELVKIDPQSIGVGQYQHDVDQNKLKESLDAVVESCVNQVGVDLNTASKHLLTYVSGLGPQLAQNIVEYRKENGAFNNRKELSNVTRMGAKAYEQCAGFLKIRDGNNPLDNTAVHPESYTIVELMAKHLKCDVTDLITDEKLRSGIDLNNYVTAERGIPTLKDIMNELDKPGRDPRKIIKVFEFENGIHNMEDLKEGMILPGIVTNITNFGAFVDVGVKQDGLVHISNLANKFISNPADYVSLHEHVKVKVLEVDISRKRIQLSMKDVNPEDTD